MPGMNGSTSLLATEMKDGKIVGQPTSMRTLTNPNNMVFNKVNLTGQVKDWTAVVGKWTKGRITDARKNPGYDKSKDAKISEILATDENILSVLSDWDDYTIYKEGDKVPEKGIKMMTDENGEWKPEITEALKTRATEVVDGVMETSIGRIQTFKEESANSDGYNKKETSAFSSGYDATWKAVKEGDFSLLDNATYQFSIVDNKIEVLNNKGGFLLALDNITPEEQAAAAKALAPYYKGFGKDPISEWDYIDNIKNTKGIGKVDAPLKKLRLSPEEEGEIKKNVGSKDMGAKETETYILDLIASKNPDLDVTFGTATQEGFTGSLPIFINDKLEGTFHTDIYFGGADEHKANQELIEAIINIGRSSKAKKKVDAFGNPI
jgi:hypothetical protein